MKLLYLSKSKFNGFSENLKIKGVKKCHTNGQSGKSKNEKKKEVKIESSLNLSTTGVCRKFIASTLHSPVNTEFDVFELKRQCQKIKRNCLLINL